MKKNNEIPLPKNREKYSIQIKVDKDLFERADAARAKRKIKKCEMIEYGLRVFLKEVEKS